jgi:hypothetical protein
MSYDNEPRVLDHNTTVKIMSYDNEPRVLDHNTNDDRIKEREARHGFNSWKLERGGERRRRRKMGRTEEEEKDGEKARGALQTMKVYFENIMTIEVSPCRRG